MTVVVVGGALMAHYELRDGTHDVDSARRLEEELKAAVAVVADRRGLAHNWLNARATAFRPATLDESECEEILSHGRLVVLAAPIDQVFLMKLHSSRARDQEDLVLAWPQTSFKDVQDVVAAYHLAYPEAPRDEFLGQYVETIIKEATGDS